MVNERRLFERLVDPDPAEQRHRDVDVHQLTESVIIHMRKLLNCRHGCTLVQPDYGIPDLNEFVFAFPDSLNFMRKAVQQAIEKYEPRLRSVRVKYLENPDNPLDLHLEITAQLLTDDKPIPISFSTHMGSVAGLEVVK
jgi:type VI secretion system protein